MVNAPNLGLPKGSLVTWIGPPLVGFVVLEVVMRRMRRPADAKRLA